MTDRSLIRTTLERFGKITELSEVTTFTGYRNGKHVTVQILDQGPDCSPPDNRFACDVQQSDGKKAGGNEGKTLDEAIGNVHWRDLD